MTTTRTTRLLLGIAAIGATAALLSGCSLLSGLTGNNDATRDDNGEVVEGNDDADVFLLQVGDCINDSELSDVVTTIPIVPCSDPHDSEVFHDFSLEDGDYPGDDAVSTSSDEGCLAEFPDFVGLAYDDSTLGYYPFTPTAESWAGGDRLVSCVIYDPAGQTTGTLEGAQR